ncbi:MAG: tripartite tricarboxylate transporter TctB family protein [Burkholderiales bacterium]|nr:tripartite tricarboxylate transporter TctB family protein [Burkholderiales bacterium]
MDRRRPRFLNADRLAAIVLLLFVAAYGWEGARFTAALQVDVVGPSFFPRILAVTGAALGVLLLLGSGDREKAPKPDGAGSHLTALAPVLLLLAYVLLLVPAGFPLATSAFLAVTFRYLGVPAWRSALAYAVAITAAAFFLFDVMLEVRLPLGLFFRPA